MIRDMLSPRVTASLPEEWQGSYTEWRAQAWIRERDVEGATLLVVAKESRSPVGLILLHESTGAESGTPQLRLGYLLNESEWGKGFASELVQGLVGWARERSYGSIVGGVGANNIGSRRVLEKCGFSCNKESNTELLYRLDL